MPHESEDPLRTWKMSAEEIWEESEGYWVNSSAAWHHFENLFASRGYDLRYHLTIDNDAYGPKSAARRPKVKLEAGLGNPFKPCKDDNMPFVHHDPVEFVRTYERAIGMWKARSPRLTFAYDRYDRIVIIKALPTPDPNKEVEIFTYLNSEPLRSHSENHTIPLLEHIVSDEGWQFLVMPAWRMGWTCNFKAWEVDEYFNVVTQLLEGLAFMHKNGLAHGDVGIDNFACNDDASLEFDSLEVQSVISRWDFRVAWLDFGCSEKFDLTKSPSEWFTSNILGTDPFIPPEKLKAQETGAPFLALPSDIYALGAVLKYILETEVDAIRQSRALHPWPVYANEVLKKHVPEFEQILHNMMDDNPTKRPTAEEALRMFTDLRKGLPNHIRFAPSQAEGYPISLMP